MRKKIIAGNWKMNTTLPEARALVEGILNGVAGNPDIVNREFLDIIIAPPFPFLTTCKDLIGKHPGIYTAAQNCYSEEKGAYTGEVSAAMIYSTGAKYVIIGHSERRSYFRENSAMLMKKVELALQNNLKPIFCIGEVLAERKSERHFKVIRQQLTESVFTLKESDFRRIIIAYEPVWAIGTGLTATPGQAQEMHAFIRQLISVKFGRKTVDHIPLLYGGSCNAQNAASLFAMPDVDGGLIGGASLKAGDFVSMITTLSQISK
ncbi:MAG TPA: triose-phosphate isomerase [Bacteroidales bacterium]|nr:triose-phosphate isomerase [Bacteroidales bacterium]HPI30317.1 triose-phosphate isomerase [Bacteroidales bacterium]HQN16493.1 triose-phosphate isomerase [Bacteroidales bacterium]HQP15245.1 triose-phosphate isomerase [Bacteroidales bacterium]